MKQLDLMRALLLLGLTSLVLSGCTSLTAPDGHLPSASGTHSPSEDPSILRVPTLVWDDSGPEYRIHRLNLDQARVAVQGLNYTEVANTQALAKAGTLLLPLTLNELATFTGFTGQQSAYDPESAIFGTVQGVAQYGEGKKLLPLRDAVSGKAFSPPEFALGKGSSGPGGVVWSEPDADWNSGDWRILWVPPGQSEVRVLASSSDIDIPSLLPTISFEDQAPVFSGSRVYWHATFAVKGSELIVPRLLSVALDDPGNVRVEEFEGFGPVNFGAQLLYLETERPEAGLPLGMPLIPRPSDIVWFDDAGNTKTMVKLADDAPSGEPMMNLGAQKGIFSFSYLSDFYIVNTDTGKVVAIPIPAESVVRGVVHCNDRVSFGFFDHKLMSGDSRYVYDVATEGLIRVQGPSFTGGAQCAGDLLSWSVAEKVDQQNLRWYVVTRWER